MTAFRLFSRLNTFYGMTGQLLAAGQLKFYDAGTTTPRPVYGDSGLAVNNGVAVRLDSSGRPDVDIWGKGSYFVELFDSLGAKQGEADGVSIPGGGGLTIPALDSSKFLTNNGAILLWSTIREVPDPVGMGGKVLGTDGENLLWQSLPRPPDSQYTVSTDMLKIGNFMIQWGRDTAPASGKAATLKLVTFPKPFANTPYFVKASVTAALATASSLVAESVSGTSTTNATFNFVTADSKERNSDPIISSIPFDWIAFGQGSA